ncbi:hypothetical protein, partial [Candidatus Symbiothrix dinenymphae]|uniref:hypothetical protein n=1 Tax=Candidatus Symbiothrix dinenymphae TaxID=467085 RepID=UPI000AA628EA
DNTNIFQKFAAGFSHGFMGLFGAEQAIYDKAWAKHKKTITDIDAQILSLAEISKNNTSTIKGDGTAETTITGGEDLDEKAAKKALAAKLKAIETEAAKQRIVAMQSYKDKKSYEEELLRIEREMLSKKQLLYQKGSNEYVKYEEEIEKVNL